jgi:hypothetical protein
MLADVRKDNSMNQRQKLVLAIAALFLVAGLAAFAQTAYTFDWGTLDVRTGYVQDEIANAVDGFGIIRDLAQMALAAPSTSAQDTHLDYIVYILEGEGGADVAVAELPIDAVYIPSENSWLVDYYPRHRYSNLFVLSGTALSTSSTPFENRPQDVSQPVRPEQTVRVVEGGAVGATANAEAGGQDLAGFLRSNAVPLIAYYAATYGVDGDLILEARLAAIEAMRGDVEALARWALDSALAALRAVDVQAKRASILELYAYSATIAGLSPTPETTYPGSWSLPGGFQDVVSLAGDLLRAVAELRDDMTSALAATVTP